MTNEQFEKVATKSNLTTLFVWLIFFLVVQFWIDAYSHYRDKQEILDKIQCTEKAK